MWLRLKQINFFSLLELVQMALLVNEREKKLNINEIVSTYTQSSSKMTRSKNCHNSFALRVCLMLNKVF